MHTPSFSTRLLLAAMALTAGLAGASAPAHATLTAAAATDLSGSFCKTVPNLCSPAVRMQIVWGDFCKSNPGFCETAKPEAATAQDEDTIDDINRRVNEKVRAKDGTAMNVASPDGPGDCKTFAATKFWLLRWAGVPAGAMRFAAVHREGDTVDHIVLVVRVDRKLVVLDNLTDVVWKADEVRYRWLAIESDNNRSEWEDLSGAPSA